MFKLSTKTVLAFQARVSSKRVLTSTWPVGRIPNILDNTLLRSNTRENIAILKENNQVF